MANEKRLIDINKFPLLPSRLDGDMSEYERGYLDAQENMNLLPTVDAVEVVRCKDCKRYEENTEARTRFCRRELNYMYAEPNGFCSYGERKDNE